MIDRLQHQAASRLPSSTVIDDLIAEIGLERGRRFADWVIARLVRGSFALVSPPSPPIPADSESMFAPEGDIKALVALLADPYSDLRSLTDQELARLQNCFVFVKAMMNTEAR